jgi:antitoxin component of RelBE/YafQ-DinJ toxin-antitoxin module
MDRRQLLFFRIDSKIAERAHRMAAQRGMDLPDVLRMMLTKAVRIGNFSIDQDSAVQARAQEEEPFDAYEPRYWAEARPHLDAEMALAVLHQAIAQRTTELEEASASREPDLDQVEQLRDERDGAIALLASFDPEDGEMVSAVLERFTSDAQPGGPAENSEDGEEPT